VSLMMGLTFGGLSGYGAYLSSKDSRNFWLLFCTCAEIEICISFSIFVCYKYDMHQYNCAVYADPVL